MSWDKQLFKDSLLSIAQGEVNGHSGVHKFGAVPAMSQNNTGTVWDVNDTMYPWASWDTAGTVSILTVNSSDNGKTITLVGLDANYQNQSEEVVVSSSGAVTTTKTWKRLYRAYVSSGTDNVGAITVQKGGVTVLQITAGKGQTLMAIYTVPAGHTAYLLSGVCSVQDGADATGNMYVRYSSEDAFRIGHSFEVAGRGGPYSHKFEIPVRLPEKTDIDVRATVRSNNARVTAAFDILLVEDGYEHA